MYYLLMFGQLVQSLKSIYSGFSSSKSNASADNPKQSSSFPGKTNSVGFSNPNFARNISSNNELELSNLNKKIAPDIISKLKPKLQGAKLQILGSNNLHDDLLRSLKQVLRDSSDHQILKNQITNISLRISDNLIESSLKALTELDNSIETIEGKNKLKNIFNEYFQSCYKLISDLNKLILEEFLESKENLQSDFIQVIQTLKETGASIAAKYLTKFSEAIKLVPDLRTDGQQSYKNLVIEMFREDIRKLLIANNFGFIDGNLPDLIFDETVLPSIKDDDQLYSYLAFITNFQKTIQGACLISPEQNGKINIASIKPELSEKIVNQYLQSIIENFELRYDKIPDSTQALELKSLQNSKNNLRQFLHNCIKNEVISYQKVLELGTLPILEDLEISSKSEVEIIKNIFERSIKTLDFLGRNSEKLPGHDIEETALHSFLNRDDAKRHFERIVLEASLIAGLEAISDYKGWKNSPENFIKNCKNYTSIPWLNDFYQSRLKVMKEMISKEKSEIGIAHVVEYISHLALELTPTGLFSPEDFFSRYGVTDYAEELLQHMTNMTRMGVMSLNILMIKSLFSTIFSKAHDIQILNPDEIRDLNVLIDFLEKESQVKNDEGELLHAPVGKSKYIDQTYTKLSNTLSNTGFLLNNAPLIIKFLRRSLEASANTKDPESKDFPSKNIILAAWLFYVLIKFIPENSTDHQSLRIKKDIFRVMFDDKLRERKVVPDILYNKLRGQALGLDDDGVTNKKGIFRTLFEELDSSIEAHAQGKKVRISLKDLLYIYQEVEQIVENNPRSTTNTKKQFATSNVHFLEGLEKALPKVIETDLKLVVNFAKNHNKSNVTNSLAKSILEKAAKLSQSLLTKNLNRANEIEILDSDQNSITSFTTTLNYLHNLGYLLNNYGNNRLTLRASDFVTDLNKDDKQAEIAKVQINIDIIDKLLKSKVTLKDNENFSPNQEVFPGQYDAKRNLIEALKKFDSLRPAVGLTYKWRGENEISTLRARSPDSVARAA